MKKILLAIFALALTTTAMAQNRNQTVTFYLNYHCGSCIQVINRNIPHERGVTNFKTDPRAKTIEITYNSRRTNPANLRKALEKLNLDVYVGCENVLNHVQKDPIIGWHDPVNNPAFDATVIYAPLMGRMFYIGLRWTPGK